MHSRSVFLAILLMAVCVDLSAQTADLSIRMTGPSFVYLDQDAIQAIHVTNFGPDTAQSVVVEFDTPWGIQLDFLSAPPGVATSTGVSGGTFWIPSIPASSTVTVWVYFHAVNGGGDVGNDWVAHVTSTTHDPAATNNDTRFFFFVGYPLFVRFSPNQAKVTPPYPLQYSLIVENGASHDLGTLKIEQDLPAGFRLFGAITADGMVLNCYTTDRFVCELPIGPNSVTTIRFVALPAPGIYYIRALVPFGFGELDADAVFTVFPSPRHRAAGH
jgi:hypothetical protein